ncbi:hypothetical protein [Streptomyces racemochromogenes]|uniref:hypothetical protein n=1 Tax=Streptomyces racemochromogenes TaxID=67353 RepID=UPI0035EEE004
MDWTLLLKELEDAVEVRNRRVASLRTAGSHVAELAAQALAAGAPAAPLRCILATMEPMSEHERRPHVCVPSPSSPPEGTGSEARPPRYSLTEACEKKILPWTAPTARKYMRGQSARRGIPVPTGRLEGHAIRYTEVELTTWLAAWRRQGDTAADQSANAGPVSG